MTDPLHLAAALDFLTSSPEARMTLTPATPERRRAMLEDTAGALSFFAGSSWPAPGPALWAALEAFALAAGVWREYLDTFTSSFEPDAAALNLHAWARVQVRDSLHGTPAPLIEALSSSFPQVSGWVATVHVCGVLSLPDAGTAAGWWAVCILAAMTAGPGFQDGEPEDLLDALLSSLGGVGRVMN